ncbi:hypothetical protein Z517_00825 [Fonsecaea pedrosoi CBS 271.37]|uniref:Uncharacterized protein n=1 Tax=Fonsecaea pedrosoi CBS 271.37 TaxID=1442368 RepID=A0A0D2H3J4_9EURO|nr:uncharacterized protein Z517_00825 [Fonsecaea pedrosoi CBS 271.37]KIW85435.1 hypothetical protein Z517_00825 [Fonsecaea pedrosoi CBS 271.37]
MQPFRIAKPRRSTKPVKTQSERRIELTDSISTDPENIAMVAYTECVNYGVIYYYDREQSSSYAECLRRQRKCDGTFSMEEFRKVGEQKKQLVAKSRAKRKEIARLRRLIAEAEEEDVSFQGELKRLEEVSSRMLRRKM